MDSPWDEGADQANSRDIEWTKISSEFTTAGYREGITAGKESAALQEGFDAGFATVGAPLGRHIGLLRGMSSAVVAFVNSSACQHADKATLLTEAGAIATRLAGVRLTDVVPRDLEAEAHAREHLVDADDGRSMDANEELGEKRKMEQLKDLLAGLGAKAPETTVRPTMEEVRALEGRLQALMTRLGLVVHRS
ncbi:hypothetical protein C8R46DRAFT_905406 [Mycena filopes]|nr:hypothetical protein C8R46DRAFT_905406 [Mycena filopes]